jgi:N utilization substance protein A
VYIDLGKTEGILPPSEQISGEDYNQGDRKKLLILEVKKTTKGPQIVLSRANTGLVKRLFELEVPEIAEGIVEIYSVSREAGSRTKIAVFSKNPDVDALGSCVGFKGARVKAIVDELNGEKIDIVIWSKEPAEFIANSLSPSKVVKVVPNEKEKSAIVVVPDYQLSLAIGKEGQNARLAAKLTNWKIDIKSETQYKEFIEKQSLKEEATAEKVEVEVESLNDGNMNHSEQGSDENADEGLDSISSEASDEISDEK